jgi:hypothetical protein
MDMVSIPVILLQRFARQGQHAATPHQGQKRPSAFTDEIKAAEV